MIRMWIEKKDSELELDIVKKEKIEKIEKIRFNTLAQIDFYILSNKLCPLMKFVDFI